MKQKYKDHSFTKATEALLGKVNSILEEYVADGYTLTLRQLFYQLVSRDIIANDQKQYSKLSRDLTNARMSGVIDWDSIEDRLRTPKIPYWVTGPKDALADTIKQYRRNRQLGQDNYIEVWLEKDALSQVLGRICDEYHIRLMVNRGYSSCSAMRSSAMRFLIRDDQDGHILYFGDHDPSGLDMVRDIGSRLREFGCGNLKVHHISLTKEQIEQHNPPPNPAKESDTRASKYVREHGRVSWELDALEPKTLAGLLRDAIDSLIDVGQFERMKQVELSEKNRIIAFADQFED